MGFTSSTLPVNDQSPNRSDQSKVEAVRSFFEQPQGYLQGRRFDIRVRAETVQELVEGTECGRILDIGCGDGSISLPLLTEKNHITLLDLSTAMTTAARNSIPERLAGNVDVVNDDFMKANLKPHSYDLILCLGVLAHVDSPPEFLARLASLLTPGGRVILEFTDCKHVTGALTRFYQWLCALRKPRRYALNAITFSYVSRLLPSNHLKQVGCFRYSWPSAPLLLKYMSQDTRYKLIRQIYGNAHRNRRRWLGNAYICLLKSDAR